MSEQIRARALGAIVGLAVGDALGAPVEFQARDSFPVVTQMMAGGYFRLPAGAWTDDTAMALCLLESLIANPDFDPRDLLNRFLRWMDLQENTSTGKCIGVGQNTLVVLGNYRRTGAIVAPFVKGRSDGNGALMRIAPVAIKHWNSPDKAREIATAQSRSTHHSGLSERICVVMTDLLSGLISGNSWETGIEQLAAKQAIPAIGPILDTNWQLKSRDDIRSRGYVLDTFEAALWAVETTSSFEDALIAAVNLGHDADTVGAVAGQLAGARYGIDAIPQRWLHCLARLDHIENLFDRLWSNTKIHLPDAQ